MKKNLLTVLGLAMIVGCMTACGSNAATENAADKVSQNATENASENAADKATENDAEKDAEKETETTADTTETTTETAVTEEITFSNDDFSITYNTANFEMFEKLDTIQFSYVNENVEAAGSNVVIITKEENSKVDDIVKTITDSRTDMEDVYDSVIGAQEIPAKLLIASSPASEGSDLNLVDNIILMQSGDDVISIEQIRTVGSNEETEMTIDGAFIVLLESFELNK